VLETAAAAAAATEPFNFNNAAARASPVPSSRVAVTAQPARVLSSAVSVSGDDDGDDLQHANLVSGLGEEPSGQAPPPQLPGAIHDEKAAAAHYRINSQ